MDLTETRAANRLTQAAVTRALRAAQRKSPTLDIVIPVYNEQHKVRRCVERLLAHLAHGFPLSYRVTIADNASTDATLEESRRLAFEYDEVSVVHLDAKGRGRALNAAWSTSDADVLVYMDVDLATDLAALLPLVAPLVSGHSDLAIGTRLNRDSRVQRGAKRELISRCYNVLLRLSLGAKFSDAQCGFKAIRADVARDLLPNVEDPGWFFDTELLIMAQRAGLRIHEVPVDWVDDADSRVDIVATALADLRGIARVQAGSLRRNLPQLLRFAVIGVGSTIGYLALFVVLREHMTAQAANALALIAMSIVNTAANRRLTFGVRGRAGMATHQLQGLVVLVAGLIVSAGSLALLQVVAPNASRTTEVLALIGANVVATLLRFALFKLWVFGRTPESVTRSTPSSASPTRRAS